MLITLILIKFAILLLVLSLIGKALYQKLTSQTENILANSYKLTRYASYLIIGLGFALVTSHLLSFITQSYRSSLNILLPVFLVVAGIPCVNFFKNKDRNWLELIKFSKVELFLLALLGYLGYIYIQVDAFTFGSWDKIHHCYVASIMENNFYPPAEPTDISQKMDYYHYGVDLIAGAFSHYLGIELWYAYALQLALFVCILIVFLFSTISLFIPSAALAAFLTIFTFFFSTLNNLEFLLRYSTIFAGYPLDLAKFFDVFKAMSALSAKNLSVRMLFYSPNMGFAMSFTSLFFLVKFLKLDELKNYIKYLIIVFCSFLLYFGEPSMWYPFFGALAIYSTIKFLYNFKPLGIEASIKASKLSLCYIASMFLGKLICMNRHISDFNGINLFSFHPSLNLNIPISWGSIYQRLFIDEILKHYKIIHHHFNYFEAPLFSEIGFREIGIFVLLGFIALLLNLFIKKQSFPVAFIFLVAFLGFLVPFFFEYSIRPEEDLRFIIFSKPFFTLAATLGFFMLSRNFNNFFSSWELIIIALMILNIAPTFYTVVTGEAPHQGHLVVTPEQSKFVKEFRKYHKSGETCLDDSMYIGWAGNSTLAGCYGLGYKLYRENKNTRETALATMNPFLLKELNVDYIVISDYDKLSAEAKQRLGDPKLFSEMKIDDSLNWHIYKFNKNFNTADNIKLADEYIWAVTMVDIDGGTLMVEDTEHHYYMSKDRKLLLDELAKIKDIIKDQSVEFVVWGSVEAFKTADFAKK